MCATIDAAAKIQLDPDRQRTLGQIASKNNLTQHEQTYVVNAICYTGGIPDDQANALIALIKNPSCTPETREYIAKELDWVGISDARRRVVDAMIENSAKGAPAGS